MPYLYCSKCGYKKLIPIAKYRFIGIGISAFGVFGWFSFLFAGSGHAFLIACSIFFFGIYFFYNAEDLEDVRHVFLILKGVVISSHETNRFS